jgi:transposase
VKKDMTEVGVDVDSKLLVCRRKLTNSKVAAKTFTNNPSGHHQFIDWATANGCTTRVCMEATGVYSFLFASTLHEANNIEVAVVNPRAIKNFAAARLQRGKTDELDARTILEYLSRMPFEPWHAPSKNLLELQLLSRRILQLTTEARREQSRRHAVERMGDQGVFLINDIDVNLRHIQRRIVMVERQIECVISRATELSRRVAQLKSITGIADKAGPRILAELSGLPKDMSARQWVAYAGLDPKPFESGGTAKPRRISKQGNRYLRDALYLPALVASQHDKHVNAYYQHLLELGKKPMQAIVAIMRKLLLAIWAMFKNDQDWQPEKFYRMQ